MRGGVYHDSISFDTQYTIAQPFGTVLRSLVLDCSTIGWQEDERVWAALALCEPKPVATGEPASKDEVSLMQDVRCFLWYKDLGCSILPPLQRSWNSFYHRYSRLIRHSVLRSLPRSVSLSKVDDLAQESWAVIVRAIRRGGYDPIQGPVAVWLAELTRRTVRNVARRRSWRKPRHQIALAEVEALLTSPHSTPEEVLAIAELAEETARKLTVIRRRNTSENYQIFCRRFLERQSIGEIAVAMDLTYKAVACRCRRLASTWNLLLEAWGGDVKCEALLCHGDLS